MTSENTAKVTYPAVMLPRNTEPTTWPPSAPTMSPMPESVANVPRRLSGTRSGMTALSGPCAKL